MADSTPDVTVNITGSIEGLRKSLAEASSMVDNWSKQKVSASTPDITSSIPKGRSGGGGSGGGGGGGSSSSGAGEAFGNQTANISQLLRLALRKYVSTNNSQDTAGIKALTTAAEKAAHGGGHKTTASIEPLKQAVAEAGESVGAAMKNAIDQSTPAQAEPLDQSNVKITDLGGSGSGPKAGAGIVLPDYDNPEVQLNALQMKGKQLAKEWRKVTANGDMSSEKANLIKEAMKSVHTQIKASTASGTKQPAQGQVLPALPTQGTDEQVREAMLEQGKELDKLLSKYQALGLGGSAAASLIAERVSFINTQLMAHEEELAKAAAKAPKPKEVKPPKEAKEVPQPKPPKEVIPKEIVQKIKPEVDTKPAVEGTVKLYDAMKLLKTVGVDTGKVGSTITSLNGMSAAAKNSSSKLLAVAAVALPVVVGVTAIGAAVTATTSLVTHSISKINAYTKELTALSNVLGGDKAAKAAMKGSYSAAKLGIDPAEIRKMLPELEAKGRGELSGGAGMELITQVTANLDPSRFAAFASAIADSYDSIRTSGTMSPSMLNSLVQLGMISGNSARQIEIMQRQGANGKQVWAALQQSLEDAASGGTKAGDSLGVAMAKIKATLSSSWSQALVSIGAKLQASLGPAMQKIQAGLQLLLPMVQQAAAWVGNMLGGFAAWIGGAIEGAIQGIVTLKNMFMSGDIKEFVLLGVSFALLSAADSFLNALAVGFQMVGTIVLQTMSLLVKGSFWSAIGNLAMSVVYMALAGITNLGSIIFDSLNPVMNWLYALFDMMGTNLAGHVMYAVASVKSALGIEGADIEKKVAQDMKDYTLDDAVKKREESGENDRRSGMATAADELAKEWADKGLAKGKEGATQAGQALSEAGKVKPFGDGDYYKPDAFKGMTDELGGKMSALMEKNAGAEIKLPKNTKVDIPDVALKDAFGQGGPKSVADSLQSVGGGGGFFASMSVDEKILEENKKQTALMQRQAGKTPKLDVNGNPAVTKTGNVAGAFGGKEGQGATELSVLIGIQDLVGTIVSLLSAGKSAAPSGGSLVTVR